MKSMITLIGIFIMGVTSACSSSSEAPTPPDAPINTTSVVDMSQSIPSAILGGNQHYTVYLPPSYASQPERKYPVLYLLHGYTQNYRSWAQGGNLKAIADKAILEGESQEMIIVCPDGLDSFYCNDYTSLRYEDFFIQEFLPAIEVRYRIDTSQKRAIAGLSMGGGMGLPFTPLNALNSLRVAML